MLTAAARIFIPKSMRGERAVVAKQKLKSLIVSEKVLADMDVAKQFLIPMLQNKSFCLNSIRRAVSQSWQELHGLPDTRPNGMEVTDMYDKRMMKCGASLVNSRLKPDVKVELHSEGYPSDMC